MLLGSVVCAGSVMGGSFLGTGASAWEGLGAGEDTLPLPAAVLVFLSPFVFSLEVADLLLLLIGRTCS